MPARIFWPAGCVRKKPFREAASIKSLELRREIGRGGRPRVGDGWHTTPGSNVDTPIAGDTTRSRMASEVLSLGHTHTHTHCEER